jgi:hypothetical protein
MRVLLVFFGELDGRYLRLMYICPHYPQIHPPFPRA